MPKYGGKFAIVAQGMAIIKVPLSGRGSKPLNIKSDQVNSKFLKVSTEICSV